GLVQPGKQVALPVRLDGGWVIECPHILCNRFELIELRAEQQREAGVRMPFDCRSHGPALLSLTGIMITVEPDAEDPLTSAIRGEDHVPVDAGRVERERTPTGPARVLARSVVLDVPLP